MRYTSRVGFMPASSTFSMSSLSRHMTYHIAAALLVFTAVQLWATAVAIDAGGPRWMPFLGLAVLVLGAIPAARYLESRWRKMSEAIRRVGWGLWAHLAFNGHTPPQPLP